ncbi:8-amino-7-oxononanoate synthase [Enterovibrio sp. ZSDZ35]|uniref:8-amino-7-oxononanoate synthase n=1 Tax=Enterovibrio qingdaonensis TaxID=2899818 RepID=A0ABT5QRT0_9GAMM|nr:8-amino-7-oxononanoate synthase [Enterovibrio sp. ZSDZ35]MDD1783684.1 8-amino-7-oxononanoate synthase [Enterovibrio sp. ZSDZ35]
MTQTCQLHRRIEQKLEDRRQNNLHRQVYAFAHQHGSLLDEQGQKYINFSSNDYLGLASEPRLVQAWQEGLSRYSAGSTASPLVTGYSKPHAELESALSDWLGFEQAILFSSGFAANQAVLFSLLEKNDVLIQDKLNHASLMEAGMLSDAKMLRFPHNDVERLNAMLAANHTSSARFVVTEGVFSMDGDLAPLTAIKSRCEQANAWLMVDDAHGVGVLGEEGRGSCDFAGIKPDILIVTFGKAFGMMGAAVLCSKAVHDYLTQFARHYVYSTAMPPAQAHALLHALNSLRTDSWRREKLAELSNAFHEELSGISGVIETMTPIKPVVIGDVVKMQTISASLRELGYWAGAIRPPTVPVNTARLRATLSVNHRVEQVRKFASSVRTLLEMEDV